MKVKRLPGARHAGVAIALAAVLAAVVFMQGSSPHLFGVDGYYHIKVPYFIRTFGLRYDFPWAALSTFADHFSDKELLFHLLIVPFTFIPAAVTVQAKAAVVFFAALLLGAFVLAQRRHAAPSLVALSLLALPLSVYFFLYLNVLRPKTLAVALVLLLLSFLVDEQWPGVLAVAFLYPFAHISYPIVVPLALLVEGARWLQERRLCGRNVLYAVLGTALGVLLHPNMPDNLLSLYLNGLLVPWNAVFPSIDLGYGLEWGPVTTKMLVLHSLFFFTALAGAAVLVMTGRVRPRFPAVALFFAAAFFFVPSLFSYAYWYYAYPVGLVFLSFFFTDALRGRPAGTGLAVVFLAGAALAANAAVAARLDLVGRQFSLLQERNAHLETVGKWMGRHLPPGERVFHTSWSESPYFICYNDKDYYLNVLDPIYMYYYSPEIFALHRAVSRGAVPDPRRPLVEAFGTRYGYAAAGWGLYRQVRRDSSRFTILYDDNQGAVFRVNVHTGDR